MMAALFQDGGICRAATNFACGAGTLWRGKHFDSRMIPSPNAAPDEGFVAARQMPPIKVAGQSSPFASAFQTDAK
jgi:hypothetical protein